jgi:RHS repeat-associated protein
LSFFYEIRSTTGTVQLVNNPANAHSGNYYVDLSAAAGTYAYLAAANIPVNPGDQITFGGWVYLESGGSSWQPGWWLGVRDANHSMFNWITPSPPGSGWTYQSGTYTVPSSGVAYVVLYATVYRNTSTTAMRVDDGFLSIARTSLTVVDSMDYLPFGEQISGDTGTTHKFTGKERDSESGLDNFGARYDSSQYGRFMSPDPLMVNELRLINPQRWNQYSYSINNPITYADPDGRDAGLVTFGGMVGGLGHDGLLSVHSDGTAQYAEFGPASHSVGNFLGAVAPGNVTIDPNLPKIQFGSDGKPTAASLQAVKQAIAKNDEGGISPDTIQITYVKTSEADTISLDNYFLQRQAAAKAGKDPYRVYAHNCDNFCQRGLVAGGVLQKPNFSIVPNVFAWQFWTIQNQPTLTQLHELVKSRICKKDDCSDQ